MTTCPSIYCRTPLPEGAELCARCGHPRDPARLKDPAFLQAAVAAVPDRPASIVDMHQILPAHPFAPTGQSMLMDGLDIDRALLQSVPPQATSLMGNEDLAALEGREPGRYRASWYIDPREADAVEQVHAAADAGRRVIKLLPVVGYRLDDVALRDSWGAVQDRSLVLLIHTGFITARHKEEERRAGAFFNASFGDPLQVDEPARRFPDVPIILAHSGGAIFCEAGAQLVTQHDNIWGDLSGFGLFALQRWLHTRAAVDWTKVFWGNDAPFFHYPGHLRLHLAALEDAGASALAPALLRDNGRAFWDRFLS